MRTSRWILFSVFVIILITVIICKSEFTPQLLEDATYGMPALIKRGYIDNLYIGSSMFRQGLDIETLDRDGESHYVLGYNGNQPIMEYYELNKLLSEGLRIKNLYIDMYAYSAWKEPAIEDEKIFMEMGFIDKVNMINLLGRDRIDFGSFWRMFVTGNNELLLFWPINYPLINSQFKNGGSLVKTESADQATLDSYSNVLIEDKMNLLQKESIKKIISLAKEENINLIFVETPKYYTTCMDSSYQNAMKEYIDFLETQGVNCYVECNTASNNNSDESCIMVYDYEVSNATYFSDLLHLSYNGRVRFSKSLVNLRKR